MTKMSVEMGNTTNVASSTQYAKSNTTTNASSKEADTKSSTTAPPAASKSGNDTYETTRGSDSDNSSVGIGKGVDPAQVQKMIKESEKQVESFRKLIEGLITKQGRTVQDVLSAIDNGEEVIVPVDEATRKKAQEDISEDGYYGVKKTTERIMDFAKALAGGENSKIDMLRKAVQDGFEGAKRQLGGDELPQISKDTYDAVMKEFDIWQGKQ